MDILTKCYHLAGPEHDVPLGPAEKGKMLDITRDKPIKVAVRVVVPVRDHPKFNFVGKLLGPKGNSMKRLQEETMCKMAVLGRGSVRDRKKEEELRLSGDPRYTHLFEDLHVEISTFAAPAEAHARIAYALAEVRRFLVPDYHDDIRQEQMWEMQALNTTSTTLNTHGMDSNASCASSSDDAGIASDPDSATESTSSAVLGTSLLLGGVGGAVVAATSTARSSSGCAGELDLCSVSSHHPLSVASPVTSTHHHASSTVTAMAATHHQQQQQQQHHHQQATVAATLNDQPTATASHHNNSHHHIASTLASLHHANHQPIPHGLTTTTKLMVAANNISSHNNNNNLLGDPSPMSETVFVDASRGLVHPALRGLKAVHIGGTLTRKRPLLGVPRTTMNPTKRTVMTLLARAKNAQTLHSLRTRHSEMAVVASALDHQPFHHQMISSPLIL